MQATGTLDEQIAGLRRRTADRLQAFHRACAIADNRAETDHFRAYAKRLHEIAGRCPPVITTNSTLRGIQ